MGVHGLWRLIEPSGKAVPLETLENKVLAVDVSIWLHQAIKGFQDSKGAPVPNAHLLGIYHRVCKLLYFKIKPIFVFDGGVPVLKKQTIARRNQLKSRNASEADRLQKQLLNTILKHSAISKVLSEKTKASITAHAKRPGRNDMYLLPLPEDDSTLSSTESEEENNRTATPDSSSTNNWDLHTIDMSSSDFKSLPVEVRHEILTDLKDTRKQNSWGRIHEMPKQSDDFSSYQMKRLLKRQSVQSALDQVAQEMGGSSLSLAELETLFKDQGILTSNDRGKSIASDENTKYLYIKDVREAIEKARKEYLDIETSTKNDISSENGELIVEIKQKTKADHEEEEELQKAIALSLQEVPSSEVSRETKKPQFSFLDDGDFQSDLSCEQLEVPSPPRVLFSAQNYMTEYSGLTSSEIQKIISEKSSKAPKKPCKKKTGQCKRENDKFNKTNQSKVDKSESVIEINEDNVLETVFGDKVLSKTISEDLDLEESNYEASKNTVSETGLYVDCIHYSESPKCVEDALLESNKDKSRSPIKDSSLELSKDADIVDTNYLIEELLSDSSESRDFIELSDEKLLKDSVIEIEIDPTKEREDDDLFSDIFDTKEDVNVIKSSNITNSPQNKNFTKEAETTVDKIQANVKYKKQTHVLGENKEKYQITEKVDIVCKQDHILEDRSTSNRITLEGKEERSTSNENTIEETKVVAKNMEEEKDDVFGIEEPKLSVRIMTDLRANLQIEKTDLLIEKSIKERMASNITDQMYQEAQELLELFGVPYIIAPMEAEAQCAFLDVIELTDGTITDDSDIWLFGGKTVYKNFFNQSKYVMEFKSENIQHNFKLNREQMILLALLVGSDYTTGIQGVGPVTALEILAAFPPSQSTEFSLSQNQLLSGLKEFKSWFNKGKTEGVGRTRLKNKLNNINFTENFPSLQVVQAYLNPKVESSKETFSWAKPDIITLSVFAKEKFGWSSKKTDEILNPVIKRLEESHNQKSIRDYFKAKIKVTSGSLDGKISKRVKSALGRFGKSQEELIAEEMADLAKEQKKNRRKVKGETEGKSRQQIGRANKSKRAADSTTEHNTKESKKNKGSKKKITTETQETEQNSEGKVTTKSQESKQNSEKKDITVSQESKKCKTIPVKPKQTRKRSNKETKETHPTKVRGIDERSQINEPISMETEDDIKTDDPIDELKLYENLAAELKIRRQRKTELQSKNKNTKWITKKKLKIDLESIPKEFKEDVQVLIATASTSVQIEEEINKEVKQELENQLNKNVKLGVSNISRLRGLHNKEIIHQKLKDKTDLLQNKMKAIEVFRMSKKGPGFVQKRQRTRQRPKEEAGLSEDSDN